MSPSSSGDKPAQTGLVDMGYIGFYDAPGLPTTNPPTNYEGPDPTFNLSDLANFTGSFSEVVLNLTWAQLQPTQSGPIDYAIIQDAIKTVTAYNIANGTDLGIKLRVWGGFTAPDWAKNIDGQPITVSGQNSVDPGNYNDQTIGRYWTADYVDAWTSLQNALATRFDSNPVIRGISQTAGAGTSDEPFVPFAVAAPASSAGHTPTVNQPAQLEAGGYNDAAESLTLRAAIAEYAQWSTTPLDYTMNNRYLFDSGNETGDPNFTLAVLQQAQNSARIVQAGNHRLEDPVYTADNFLYSQLQAGAALDPAFAPASYQTQSPDGLAENTPTVSNPDFTGPYADWPGAIAQGVASGAGDVELWAYSGPTNAVNGFQTLSSSQVQILATQLAAGAPPTGGAPDDGSALGFVAPAFVTGAAGTVAFTGTGSVLLASTTSQPSYTVTLTAEHGTLGVTDVFGIVSGSTNGSASGTTITMTGTLDQVNTVLASLTDTVQSGNDEVIITASDGVGPNLTTVTRTVGLQIAAPVVAASPGAQSILGSFSGDGILAVGGVNSTDNISGDLQIGPNGTATNLLAALSPDAYATATLTIGGALEIESGGTAWFSGDLSAAAVKVDGDAVISGAGTLTASTANASITNDGTIEAVADTTLGLQQLTVSNDLTADSGDSGKSIIDPGATLILNGAVNSSQTITFGPNSINQFANDPYSPSTLELGSPGAVSGTITGVTFADELILEDIDASSASYDGTSTLTVNEAGGGSLTFSVPVSQSSGLADLTAVVVSSDSSESIIGFVAPAGGLKPNVSAPATLEGSANNAVLVPDIVINAPFPSTLPANQDITVTLTAASGTLTAGTAGTLDGSGNPVAITNNGTSSITITGTLGQVERSLQDLTYTAPASTPTNSITITVSDYAGTATTPAVISVSNNSAPPVFNWTATNGGNFSTPGNWQTPSHGSEVTPPGGTNDADFGSGIYTVTGDGDVGKIVVSGTPTFTGQITAQGAGVALDVDRGGALTLAAGALLTIGHEAVVGGIDQGLLFLMGGALTLPSTTSTALDLGQKSGSSGTIINLEQITAKGVVVVGDAGTGDLELRGVASSVSDGGADIGRSAGGKGEVLVNGGEWTNSGDLTVGEAGIGLLNVSGMNDGIAGQVTAFNAMIGSQTGSQGTVTLDGGEFLVANDFVPTSTLTVGGGGSGILTIQNGSEVDVGAALGKPSNNSTTTYPNTGELDVGEVAGGSGHVTITGDSALLVYGNATVGGAGTGLVTVGLRSDDAALWALIGALAVNAGGQVALGGSNSTVRASAIDVNEGGQISGAGTVTGDVGGNETATRAGIDNNGIITASGGNLLINGDITGTGTLSIGAHATMTLQGSVSAGQTLSFGQDSTVVIANPDTFLGTIANFTPGDVLELGNTSATSATLSGGVLTVDPPGAPIQFNVAGNFSGLAFTVQPDGLGGTDVEVAPGGTGDVHLVTFDGLHYDFQAVGQFVAVESAVPDNPWQVQIQTAPSGDAASVTTELAATLGSDRMTFGIDRTNVVYVDGVPDATLKVGATQTFAGGTLAEPASDHYQLILNGGESIGVTDLGTYFNWTVALGADDGPGSVRGLLGSNSGWESDMQLSNGTVLWEAAPAAILGEYADSWRVQPGASLLDDSYPHALPGPSASPIPSAQEHNVWGLV